MLARAQRLQSSQDIMRCYRGKKRAFEGGVQVAAVENTLRTSRIAVVVSKKFSQKAVRRNKQKRLFLAAYTEYAQKVIPGWDIVISYNKHEEMLSYKEASDVLAKSLSQLKILS